MATEQSVMGAIRAARPQFLKDHDKVAFALHAAFSAAGFDLIASGTRASGDDVFSISTSDEVGMNDWNLLPENYAFLYSNPEGSKKVLMKALVMNDTLVVDVLKEGASEPQHLELNTPEFTEMGGTAPASHYKNLGRLVEKVNKEILDKLDIAPASNLSNQPSSPEARVRKDGDRTMMEFVGPDDREFLSTPPTGDFVPGPGSGFRGIFGMRGPGGMLVGPNDPMFFGPGIRQPGMPGVPSGVPPGARFDPFGPPDVPGFEPNIVGRYPHTRGRGMHPDLERFHDGSDFI